MSMALYACTFKWIIERINARIKGNSNYASIGILDIFGFENFEVRFIYSNLRSCLVLHTQPGRSLGPVAFHPIKISHAGEVSISYNKNNKLIIVTTTKYIII